MIDYLLSVTVAHLSKAQPQDCFCNAWEALAHWLRKGFYVEGWIAIEFDDEIQVVEHAWCVLSDGFIVDPTAIFLDGEIFYFLGVQYSYGETVAFEGELLPHVRFTGEFGSDGMGHTAYRDAYESARRHAQGKGKRVVALPAVVQEGE